MTTHFEPPKAEDRIECETCGETDLNRLTYGPEPYEEEVNGKIILMWLCDRCIEISIDDI